MLAEIGLSDLVIGQNFGRRARGDNVALSDDISPLANVQCLSDIMVGDQDTNIARFEVRDDVLDIRDGDRVNPCKRFVQQDHSRLRRQRSRDLNPSPLASRKRMSDRFCQMTHIKLLEQCLGRFFSVFSSEFFTCFEDGE